MKKDVVVVGSGLFGCVIAAHLRAARGRRVLVVDAGREHAASPAASCLMKPATYSSALGVDGARAGLGVLDALYGVRTLEFLADGGRRTPIYWVPPEAVLAPPDVRAEVHRVTSRPAGVELMMRRNGEEQCLLSRAAVICAGVWSKLLVRDRQLVTGLTGRVGCASTYRGQLPEARMHEWAPYKHMYAFNVRSNQVWVGDGAAFIIPANWARHEPANWARCDKEAAHLPVEHRLRGVSPYMAKPQGPCFLREVMPNVWVATGAGKNGTLAAGWAAHELAGRF